MRGARLAARELDSVAHKLAASSVRPHTLVASSLRHDTLVASVARELKSLCPSLSYAFYAGHKALPGIDAHKLGGLGFRSWSRSSEV